MAKRVVITGLGALSPNGNTAQDSWDNIKKGVNGITPLTRVVIEGLPVKFAGQLQNFDVFDYLDKKEVRRFDEYSQYGVIAGTQAMEDADFKDNRPPAEEFGVILGSGVGGLDTSEREHTKLYERGFRRVNPLLIPMMISNMGAGNLAVRLGLKGHCTCVTTACASAAHSIGDAYRLIKHGYQTAMLAGGAESPVKLLAISGFLGLQAVTTTSELDRASIPFDKERSGFIIGEGAGVLVLEEYEHAIKRGAKIYGEILGYGATCDAYHMTAPEPEGTCMANAMELAIKEAGIAKEEIGYINAHGTSTPLNDKIETLSIKRVFGENTKIPISSTKSMTGHLLGAAGGIEAIFSIKAMEDGILPPTINLKVKDEECDLDYIPNIARKQEIKYCMSNSLAFGGQNACLLFGKVE